MYHYYYRSADESELIIQVVAAEHPLSIRVTEPGGADTAVINLPAEQIDCMIERLQRAKQTIEKIKKFDQSHIEDQIEWLEEVVAQKRIDK